MRAVFGLGNPGTEYQRTRHNVGFMTVEELARRHGDGGVKTKFEAEIAEITLPVETRPPKPAKRQRSSDAGPEATSAEVSSQSSEPVRTEEKILLVEPLTYMNNSGRTVGKLVDFYNLQLDRVLVICDDMNLTSGQLRLRGSGSAGGQNGIKDIIRALGSQEFARLRIGIGRPPGRMPAKSYVLGRFTAEEKETIELAIANAADGVERWVLQGTERAMNTVNAPSGS